MNFSGDRQKRALMALEVTPLVDVVFLLLIFFLLTATYVKNPNIDINLPKASSSEVFPTEQDITIAVKADGTIKFGRRTVKLTALGSVLTAAKKNAGSNPRIIVNADKGARHGRVVSVMDAAKKAGFSRLAIAVRVP